MRSLNADEVRWLRVRAQGLAGDGIGVSDGLEPAAGADADGDGNGNANANANAPKAATRAVTTATRTAAALQAQAAAPLRLQVWSRTHGLHAADVDAAVAEAAVVRTWLMRGTIHMVAADDLRAFLAVLGPVNLRADRRRREQLGLSDQLCARAMDALPQILAGGRALTRAEIVVELAGHGVVVDLKSQQPPHLLAFAANSALICRGPDAARDEPTYVLLDDWLASAGASPPHEPGPGPDRETALARLAERYFAAYGPATTADLAAWSGLSAADAKAAVALVRDSLEEVEHDGQRLLLPHGTDPADPADSAARAESADRADSAARAKSADRADPADLADPTARAKSADRANPAARADPADPTARAKSADRAARADPAARAARATPTTPTTPTPPQNPHRLLARFDPYLLGHRSRDLILAPAFAKRVNAGGGMIAQTMLAGGRVVGTWKPNLLQPFEDLPPGAAEAWQREMDSAAAF
jgi:hypothetical protein